MKQPHTVFSSIHTTIDIPTDDDEYEDHWNGLTIAEHDSLLTRLNRVYVYWRQTVFNKLRFIFTLVFVSMLNIATRLTSFTRKKTAAQSAPPLSSIVDSLSNQTFEQELNYSPTSYINHNSHLQLPSSETSPMAHMLVQQQTPNINLHQTTSTEEKDLSPTADSLDERVFFYPPGSERLFQLLQRFASESNMPKYEPNLSLSSTKPQDSNCDIIAEDTQSNELEGDVPLQTSATVNTEQPMQRRKRPSSLMKTCSSDDQTEPLITDSIEKVDDNNNNTTSTEETNENIPPISIETLSIQGKKEESNDQNTLSNSIRGRRSRYRSYRQTVPTSPESVTHTIAQVFVPAEPSISTPPASPSQPPAGGLKRSNSYGTTKKMVRFADSVGRELAHVQYIQSFFDDDLSFGKNELYLPRTFSNEYKPWSFDITAKCQQFPNNSTPRRFFCLYRQPNSEHPDIYLHEIWKSQIKLEHADVRLKSSLSSEQYLHGKLWVTNASYWKNVTVKYTFNHWINTYEYDAQHLCHSNDFRNVDQFEFSIDIPHDVDRIDFVLRYRVNGQEYWDNNEGKNYTIETDSASIPATKISLPHDCDFNEMRFY